MDSGVCDTPLQAIWRDADITLWFQSCSDFPAWQGRNRPPFSFKKRYGKRCLTHADKLSGSMGRTDQRYGKRFHAPKRSRNNAQTGSKREVKQFFGRQKKRLSLRQPLFENSKPFYHKATLPPMPKSREAEPKPKALKTLLMVGRVITHLPLSSLEI